jgi:hypothetical protein
MLTDNLKRRRNIGRQQLRQRDKHCLQEDGTDKHGLIHGVNDDEKAYGREVFYFSVLNTEVNRDREPIAVAYI